jgi:hypothetical protein
MTKRQQ